MILAFFQDGKNGMAFYAFHALSQRAEWIMESRSLKKAAYQYTGLSKSGRLPFIFNASSRSICCSSTSTALAVSPMSPFFARLSTVCA
jgi:hypothetical protein